MVEAEEKVNKWTVEIEDLKQDLANEKETSAELKNEVMLFKLSQSFMQGKKGVVKLPYFFMSLSKLLAKESLCTYSLRTIRNN